MGSIALDTIEDIEYKTRVLKAALERFDERRKRDDIVSITHAVKLAYSESFLFTEFEHWYDKKIDDSALLFQVQHFLKRLNEKPLPEKKRNLTGNKAAIERIKKSADKETGAKFAKYLRILATKKGLTTNESLGDFLKVSAERARVLLTGAHKPNRETLLKVAKAFGEPVERFLG